jgi:pimeloyl-ACP methyl ester carboxylesterase
VGELPAIITRMTHAQTIAINYQNHTYATNYRDEGDGDVVLFLHGWGANIDLIMPLAERLQRLGYRVIALDLPGFGETEEPAEAWTVFNYAEFVKAFCEQLHLKIFHLFGHSFGGRLSLVLGAEANTGIQKIILAGSAGIVESAPLLPRLRLSAYKSIRDGLYKIGAKALADDLRQRYNVRYGSSDFQQTSGIMRTTFVNVIQQDLQDYARRVQHPTLMFWGDKDEETPLHFGQTFERIIPDAGLVILEGCGHYSYLEKAEHVAKVMHHFFQN